MCYFILLKFSTVNGYCYRHFFKKGNNQDCILKICTDVFRLMNPLWLGADPVLPHPVVSYAPKKVFISQPRPVRSALRPLQIAPPSLCALQVQPPPKPNCATQHSLKAPFFPASGPWRMLLLSFLPRPPPWLPLTLRAQLRQQSPLLCAPLAAPIRLTGDVSRAGPRSDDPLDFTAALGSICE